MPGQRVVVRGYTDLLRAVKTAEKDTKKQVRGAFKRVGDIVRVDATHLFSRYDPKSAAGFRTVVRQRGVAVEQRLRRTTGQHPGFGALQMRTSLIPSLEKNKDDVVRETDRALVEVLDVFNRVRP